MNATEAPPGPTSAPGDQPVDQRGGPLGAPLGVRLDAAYAELSPQETRAADFMREHLADLAVYNAAEVARLSGVSKATISRLFRRLGFANAEELRDHVRALRGAGTPLVSSVPASDSAHLEQETRNLRAALAVDLDPAARLIAGARRVLVIGFRNSYPVALHLRQQLSQARDATVLAPAPGQSLGEELAGLTAADVVVLVGFRRRPSSFADVVAAAVSGPASVVLLSDASGRRHAASTDLHLECPVDSVTAFDSYAAVFSLVSSLAAAVLAVDARSGRERIGAIGQLYAELDELE